MRPHVRRVLSVALAVALGAVATLALATPASAASEVSVSLLTPAPVHPGDVIQVGGSSDAGAEIAGVEFFGEDGETSLGAPDAGTCQGLASDEVAHSWSCSWTVPLTVPTPTTVDVAVDVSGQAPSTTSFDVVEETPSLHIDDSTPVYPSSSLTITGRTGTNRILEDLSATSGGITNPLPYYAFSCTGSPAYTCTVAAPIGEWGFGPGDWTITGEFAPTGGGAAATASDTVTVGSPATIGVTSGPVHPGDVVAFGGARLAGGQLSAFRLDGSLISPACSGVSGAVTSWSCTWSPPNTLAVGTHTLSTMFVDASTEEGTTITTTFPVEDVVVPSTVPPAAPQLPPTAWTLGFGGLDLAHLHPGDHFTASGSGVPAGATVTFVLHSTPRVLGSTTADDAGRYRFAGVIPADVELGAHRIIATITGAGIIASSAVRDATVRPFDAATPTVPEAEQQPGTAPAPESAQSGGGASETGETTAGAPHEQREPEESTNVLTDGLDSIGDVVAHPAKVPAALAIGLVLLLFGVLPAHLLDSTVSEQYEHAARRFPRLRRRPRWWERLNALLRRAPGVGGLVITAAAAFLFCFADPRFGFTLASLRLVLALAVALFVVTYVVDWITAIVMRRAWDVAVSVQLRPFGLVLSLAGVILSRALHFSPGFLIGLVLGLSIAGSAAGRYAWRAILLRSGIILGLALAAWVGFSAFSHEGAESDFTSALLLELLVAIATEGVVALLVELLPFRLLEGAQLFRRSKLVWGGVYLLGLVVFVVVVVPWEGNWAELGSGLWTWLAILGGFAVLAVGTYLFFRVRSRGEHEVSEPDIAEAGNPEQHAPTRR